MTVTLAELVRDRWAPLLDDADFTVATEDDSFVVLTSTEVRIVATHSPNGEVSVEVHRHDQERWQGWSYEGMVGAASVGRLLELALEDMRADPAVLQGDRALFVALQERAVADAEAWAANYAGKGSRPGRRAPLP
jgi:hypothetical protein